MKVLITLIFCLGTTAAFADEGFFLGSPPNLQAAWDNSVMIEMVHATASGTLIRQEKIDDKYYLYVLSAGHLDLEWPLNQPVVPSQSLMIPKVYGNVNLPMQPIFSPGIPGATGDKTDGPGVKEEISGNIKFVWGFLGESEEGDKNAIDAGLLVFEEDQPLPNFQTIQVAEATEEVVGTQIFAIGFPAVDFRPVSAQLIKIEQPNVITKRWSKGVFEGNLSFADISCLAGTADTLPGNSGGAIFNQAGHILGLVSTGSSRPEKGYSYDEATPWPVIAARTQTLRDFLPSTIELFKKSLAK